MKNKHTRLFVFLHTSMCGASFLAVYPFPDGQLACLMLPLFARHSLPPTQLSAGSIRCRASSFMTISTAA
ncbi:exported hypothetical protein [Chelatococcus asaccharovorans]|nr:exported hypothetical protein [Chelatococcus asaccharovorans]CAH1693346.1 exported hypothetical protein [Chelatococcus asaccharovorans]